MYTIELKELMDDQMFEVFDFDMPFYCDSEQAKHEWQCKFLSEYAFYDINSETVARWKWMLETKLRKIMPYYEQLYLTELKAKDINFLVNKEYRETFMKDTERENAETGKTTSSGTQTTTGKVDGTSSSTANSNSTNTSKVSNIDNGLGDVGLTQGKLTGMSEDKASGTETASGTQGQTSSGSANTNSTLDNTKDGSEKGKESYVLEGIGNIGTTSSAELLEKWRQTILNIDELLLKDCKDLFLMVF